jgi:anti-sigma B factor antagonist
MMQIAHETRSGWNIVSLTGRADALAAQELEEALDAAAKVSSKIAVDVSALDYISSAGLRSLLQGARAAQMHQCEFMVCGPRAAVKNVFDISGMQHILRIENALPC